MSRKNEMYRALLGRPTATLAANIFDPLSARIAQIAGYELLVLSGSVGKASNLAAPDLVISTLPDVQDHVRRITRNTPTAGLGTRAPPASPTWSPSTPRAEVPAGPSPPT